MTQLERIASLLNNTFEELTAAPTGGPAVSTPRFSAVLAAEVRLEKGGIVPGGRLCFNGNQRNFDSDDHYNTL